ncbi:hypothetical protein AOQ84DRAFT_392605 [Glonium stellatum]|uniref:Uncharacterized protein n=1 Tax=Glonium stellatum TaxID=574774 RepID=A0A8E2EQU9_9PEZI|nr:hypothetical protein AOQ84DRAFT_392605 [Glonium stellatum]
MPHILSLPRELRDEIYKWGLLDDLASAKSRALQRERKRVSHSTIDSETYYGEESVRYPEHTSLPPTYPLLQTSRQLRAELLDSVKRMGPLRYKIDLANRDDQDVLYPTWISVPIFSKRVDVLDVELRIRNGKTSSVYSVVGDDEVEYEGDVFSAGLVVLQRFLERGVYFLSKKKAKRIQVGLLAVNINTREDVSDKSTVEVADILEEWMMGQSDLGGGPHAKEREDKQFRFLTQRIENVRLSVNGRLSREWKLEDMLRKRDEIELERQAEVVTA